MSVLNTFVLRSGHMASLLAVIAMTTGIGHTVALADDEPQGTVVFSVNTTNEMWENNSSPGKVMTSLEPQGGSLWSTWAFTHSTDYYGLWCGIREVPAVATLTNVTPIPQKIGLVSAYIFYEDYPEYINSIVLRTSTTSDFAQYNDIEIPTPSANSSFWNFYIPEPAENLYYQLRIDFKAFQSNWIRVSVVNFYAPDELKVPEMSSSADYDGSYSIVSHSGELHLIASEYTADGTFVGNVIEPSTATEPGVIIADDDTSWRNKVAEIDEEYRIYPPETTGNYITVRAKSVDGERQSEELVESINYDGQMSALTSIASDKGANGATWYNLQGMKVEHPGHGVYIRVEDGKAAKVVL